MPCHANNLSWEPAVFYVISINPGFAVFEVILDWGSQGRNPRSVAEAVFAFF